MVQEEKNNLCNRPGAVFKVHCIARVLQWCIVEDWFLQHTWNIHKSGSAAAESLTFAIQESLSEYSSGHLDFAELRAEMQSLIDRENKVVNIAEAPQYGVKISSAPIRWLRAAEA